MDNDKVYADNTIKISFYFTHNTLSLVTGLFYPHLDNTEHDMETKCDINRVVPTAKPFSKHKIVQIMKQQ